MIVRTKTVEIPVTLDEFRANEKYQAISDRMSSISDIVGIKVSIISMYGPGIKQDTCRSLFEFFVECSKMLLTWDALDVNSYGVPIGECVLQLPEPYRTGCTDLCLRWRGEDDWRLQATYMKCLPCDVTLYEQAMKLAGKYGLNIL